MSSSLPRRALLGIATATALVGCAATKTVVLDRQAAAGIKRIGLPTVGMPKSPDVTVINTASKQMAGFGLIGAIGALSGSIVRGNRSDSLVRMMAAQNFDPGPAFNALLVTDLQAKGFEVVPIPINPRRAFLPTAPSSPAYDAVLDCYVFQYGFTALDDSDSSPYRATVIVPVRLVGGSGAVLMEDTVVISGSGVPTPATATAGPTEPTPVAFTSFSDAEKDPATAVNALRSAFELAATGIVRRAS